MTTTLMTLIILSVDRQAMRDVGCHHLMAPSLNRTRIATRTPLIDRVKVIIVIIIINIINNTISNSHVTDAVMCGRTLSDVVWNGMKDRRDQQIHGTAPLLTAPSVVIEAGQNND